MALAVAHRPLSVAALSELCALASRADTIASQPSPRQLRAWLEQLRAAGLATVDRRDCWSANEPQATLNWVQHMRQPVQRRRWWEAWRQWSGLAHSHWMAPWRDEDKVAGLRMLAYGGGGLADYERLSRLCGGPPHEQPLVLLEAVLLPFDAELWRGVDPELRLLLLKALLALPAGEAETLSSGLWEWLREEASPDPEALHDFTRYALAERLLFSGDPNAACAVVSGLPHPQADAVRAAALIVQGQWEPGIAAYAAALKARAAATGRRKQLLPEALNWCYALALLSRTQPEQWAEARRFFAQEAGRREANPYTFWGLWQHAFDQRLGDAPRRPLSPPVANPRHWTGDALALQQVSHWLLNLWLGHEGAANASQREAQARRCREFAGLYGAGGQHWLAGLMRVAAARMLGHEPDAADAAQPFPFAAAPERWRDALQAIVALGPAGGSPADNAAAQPPLTWALATDAGGRVRAIVPLQRVSGKDSAGTRFKPVALATLALRTDCAPADAAVLRGLSRPNPYLRQHSLVPSIALPALVGHPALVWADAPQQAFSLVEAQPRIEVLTEGEHLRFRLVDPIHPDEAAERSRAEAQARLAAEPLPQAIVYGRAPWDGLVPDEGLDALRLMRDSPTEARLLRLTQAHFRVAELVREGWRVPASAREALDAALRVLGSHFQLASDADAGESLEASRVLHAELRPQAAGLQLRLVAAPFGDFGPRLPPGVGRARVTTVHAGRTVSTERDLAAERAGRSRLLAALPQLVDVAPAAHEWSLDDPEDALALVEALASLGPDIVAEWPAGGRMRVRQASPSQLALRVERRQDWLALQGELRLDDGEVMRLQALLALLAKGRGRWVALGEGDYLALSDTLRRQLDDLHHLSQPSGRDSLRLSPAAALAWSAQPEAPTLAGDAAWVARCAAWAAARDAVPALPAGLRADLRDYQHSGWTWLMRLAASGFGALLADDMGLGKTVQTLALLAARAPAGPALVVAPTSVCGNWLLEAARFTPGLRVQMYGAADAAEEGKSAEGSDADADTVEPQAPNVPVQHPTHPQPAADTPPAATPSPRQMQRRRQLEALGPQDLLVISYGLLQADAALLAAQTWHTVVLDEAQAIKNAATQRAGAAHALRAEFRLALTGTPVENRLGELWSIMAFVNPGLLGTAAQFHQRFAGPIERDGDAEARQRLRRLIAPFVLRRTKSDVLSDLPPRTEIIHPVLPSPRERVFHEALRREAEARVHEVLNAASGDMQERTVHILAALTRLRRAACDPRLVAPALGLSGAKLDALEALAHELVAGGHKTLVFSQFTDFLTLLRERLEATGLSCQYLDGRTPAAQRSRRVAAFQAGDGDFFLISLKAGGFGLNLTMADYVLIADPWWNPAAEDQATGRAHRIGQTRPVTVYRLVTRGTVEERIVALHQHKRALAEGLLDAADADAAGSGLPLDAQALLALLRGEAP